MVCPKCHHPKTRIYNSRSNKRTFQTWRRHKCLACGFTFSTREVIEADQALLVQQGDKPQKFSRATLLLSLALACDHRTDDADAAFYLAGVIEAKLHILSVKGVISEKQITATALDTLKNYDAKAYLKYLSARKEIIDERDLKNILG